RFDHVLIRELLYSRLDPEARARFHRKIGEHCAAIAKDRPLTGRECYMAAVHFSRAEDSRKSLAYFQKAFDYLRYKHAHGRAYRLALQAVEHVKSLEHTAEASDPAFRCDLYLKQAEVTGFLGHREVQFSALKAALQAGKESENPILMALVRLRFGQYYHATSRYLSALNALEGALILMRRIEDRRGEADALEAESLVFMDIGDEDRAMKSLRQAIAIRDRLEDRPGRAGVLVLMAKYYLDHAKWVAAGEALDKARQIYKGLNDSRGQASVLMGLAKVEIGQGNVIKAKKILLETLRIARRIGDAVLEADLYATLGGCYQISGSDSKALDTFRKAYRIAQTMRDRARQVRLSCTLVDLLIRPEAQNPDAAEALILARKAVGISKKAELPVRDHVEALNTLASVFLKMDRGLSAFAIYRKVLRILEQEEDSQDLINAARLKFEKAAKRLGREK
ncbi:MAG: tetratricopeptide repeat protein, partial [Planctomycetes bacterium]|nr:tetratricopeptide repeat protein [Planctomycetota bacterium]